MSTAHLVLDYINAVKWPLVAAGALVYFRRPLASILKNIADSDEGSAKIGNLAEFSWKRKLQAVDEAVAKVEQQTATDRAGFATETSDSEDVRRMLETRGGTGGSPPIWSRDSLRRRNPARRPEGATAGKAVAEIEQAYGDVRRALEQVAAGRGVEEVADKTPIKLIADAGLPDAVLQAVGELSDLRNLALHTDYTPSKEDVEGYVMRAAVVERLINQYGAGGRREHDQY